MQDGTGISALTGGFDRQFRLDAVPLRFRDSRMEEAFRRSWLHATDSVNVIWKSATFAAYVTLSLILAFFASTGFIEFQWFRYAIVLPLMAVSLIYAFAKGRREGWYHVLFLATGFAAFGNAVYSYILADIADRRMYLFECALVFVLVQCYFPARWASIAVFSVLGTLSAVSAFVIADLLGRTPDVPTSMLVLTTIGLTLTCCSASYAREFLARRNYREIQRARLLKAQADRLAEQANEAALSKSRFLANAAHELRTPLNGICGYAEMARMGMAGELDEPTRLRFLRIENSARQLRTLVESVLESAEGRLSSEPRPWMHFDLVEAIRSSAARAKSTHPDNPVTFPEPKPGNRLIIQGDPDVYAAMLDNMIDRATGDGSEAAVLNLKDHGTGGLTVTACPGGAPPSESEGASLTGGITEILAEAQGARYRRISEGDGGDTVTLFVPETRINRVPVSPDSRHRAAS